MESRLLNWNKAAIVQFQKAIKYIARDTPSNAQNVAKSIMEEIERLTSHPEIHTPDKYKKANRGDYRAFELFRLRVAYFANEKEVRILRIRHTSQEPKMY